MVVKATLLVMEAFFYPMISFASNSDPQSWGPFAPRVSDNTAKMPAMLFSLKTMELFKNGLKLYSGAPPLFSVRTASLASWQRER